MITTNCDDLRVMEPALAPEPTLTDNDPSPDYSPSRRSLLTAGILSAALLAAGKEAEAQAGTFNPVTSWRRPEFRLVRRLTTGLNITEAKIAADMGYDAYLERQLNYTALDDSAVDNFIATNYPNLSLSAKAMYNLATGTPAVTVKNDLLDAALYRSIYSRRQLYQRMVEFWTDHFNTDYNKVDLLKAVDDRDVIRPNAMTTFGTILLASAQSPAMLLYLDQYNSRGNGTNKPNQNYAREVMELHTLGVNGGYSQTDVAEVARCLTGWTYVTDTTKANYGTFVYDATRHDTGTKNVLGNTITNNGMNEGITVFNILQNYIKPGATYPSAGVFVGGKLARWLLSDQPPQAVVDAAAAAYAATGGDIKAMIRAILNQSFLMNAPARYKRPYHLIASAMRAINPTVSGSGATYGIGSLRGQPGSMGQKIYEWAPPNGYPDVLPYWVGYILPRWNFGFLLPNNNFGNVAVDVTSLQQLGSADKIVARLSDVLHAGEMPSNERAQLIAYLKPSITATSIRDTIGLALAAPSFQWY